MVYVRDVGPIYVCVLYSAGQFSEDILVHCREQCHMDV